MNIDAIQIEAGPLCWELPNCLGIRLISSALHLITGKDPLGVAVQIIFGLIIAGGITYAWTRGLLRRPSRCAQLGAVWGAFLGIALHFVYFVVISAGLKQKPALVDFDSYSRGNYCVPAHGLCRWLDVGQSSGAASHPKRRDRRHHGFSGIRGIEFCCHPDRSV